MARKRFTTQTKSVRSFLFDGWLVKQIMKGFGWYYKGDEIEEEAKDIAETQLHDETHATTVVRTETKTKKYLEFHRVSPYSKNPLFNLLKSRKICKHVIFCEQSGGHLKKDKKREKTPLGATHHGAVSPLKSRKFVFAAKKQIL